MTPLELVPANTVEKFSRFFTDLGPVGMNIYFSTQVVLFYALVIVIVLTLIVQKPDGIGNIYKRTMRWSNVFFLIVACAFMLMSRIPRIVDGYLNPDEALWIAIAKTVVHDPRYWVSVDGGTGGPLVPSALLLLKIFGLPIDFGSVKIMTGLTMILSVVALYQAFRLIFDDVFSMLVILPVVVAISFMDGDVLAYNCEHIADLLLCFSLYFLARVWRYGAGRYSANLLLLALLLGLVPFAKLQAVPAALFIGAFAVAMVSIKLNIRAALALIGGSLLPSVAILSAVALYGGWDDFLQSYIFSNVGYVEKVDTKTFAEYYDLLIQILLISPELVFFFKSSIIVGAIGLVMSALTVAKTSIKNLVVAGFALGLLFVSAVCVVTPGRGFGHYLVLFIFPVTVGMACAWWPAVSALDALCRGSRRGLLVAMKWAGALCMIVGTVYYFNTLYSRNPSFVEKARARYDEYIPQRNVVAILNRYFRPGYRMAVWGWGTELWSGTEFTMGTRDGTTGFQLTPGPNQLYYVHRYVRDLERNKPEVFIDAVAPNFAFFDNRNLWGHELVPMVNDYVNDHYRFEAEIDGARIYLRQNVPEPTEKFVFTMDGGETGVNEFHASLENILHNGSFLQFTGWTVLVNDTDMQQVQLALINKSDTLLLKTYQTAKKSVVDFSPNNRDNLWCGYLGFVPWKDIPKGEYEIGLRVNNDGAIGFKKINQSIVID
jgi:hypothetical protein